MDLLYHALSNIDQDKAIVRNLPRLWFMVRIHITADPNKGCESHFVGLHKKGEHHFDFGGEDGAQLCCIHDNKIETVFFEPCDKTMLLSTIEKILEM